MSLKKISLENFTVFDKMDAEFCDGINVFIGENGTGKTHLLKLLYAFCESGTLSQNTKLLFFKTLCKCFHSEQLSFLINQISKPLAFTVDINEKKYLYQAVFKDNIADDERLEPPLNNVMITFQIEGQREKETLQTAFIPAKEMLTHAGIEKDYIERTIPFDKTLVDILFKSGMSNLRTLSPTAQTILDNIKQIIEGTVLFEKDRYFILRAGHKVSFQSEAEGFKKLSVLWRLVETGLISRGSILFWDEPEANITPKHIPLLVEMLYTLQSAGVQVFIATHDYVLAKYLELYSSEKKRIRFHSLYRGMDSISLETSDTFKDLEHNTIADAYNKLLDEVFEQTTRGE
ncbi:MAG: AAA family ATPase [Anaerocolumna sp.]